MSFFIIADDFGMSKSTNYAIIDGIKRGIISSTNIMINMPYVEEGKKILEMDIDCPLGIHWNLTAGQALSNSADIESLVDEKGYFYSREVFDKKIIHGEINKRDIEKEICLQTKQFIEMYGIPRYWNTHQHIHMNSKLFPLFVKIAEKYNILYMRNNIQFEYKGMKVIDYFKNYVKKIAYLYAKKHHMNYLDGLVRFSNIFPKYSYDSYRKLKGEKQYEVILHISKEIDSIYFGSLMEERINEYNFYISDGFLSIKKEVNSCNC